MSVVADIDGQQGQWSLNEGALTFKDEATNLCYDWHHRRKSFDDEIGPRLLILADDFARGALETGSYELVDRCLPSGMRSQMVFEVLQNYDLPYYATLCLHHSAPRTIQ